MIDNAIDEEMSIGLKTCRPGYNICNPGLNFDPR
jgi:hypothetical protein